MACANKTFLLLEFVAEVFNGKTSEFSGFFIFPFAPALITKKIVERSLSACGFDIISIRSYVQQHQLVV